MLNRSLLKYSLLILFLLISILALNYWPNADDFCFRTRIDQDGLYNYLEGYYLHWSGRIFTLSILGLIIKVLPLEHSNLITLLFVFLFIFSIFLTAQFFTQFIKTKIINLIFLFFFLFWFGLRGIIGEVVFWPTGAATYLIPYTLLILWLIFINQQLKNQTTNFLLMILSFVFSLILGNCIEVLSPLIFTYLFLILIFDFANLDNKKKKFILINLIAIIIGTLLLIMAPGNFERAKSFPQGVDFDLFSMSSNLIQVFFIFLSFTKTMLMYVLFSTVILFSLDSNFYIDIKKSRKYILILLLSSLSSLIPLASVDVHFTTRRTTFYFAVFLSLTALLFILSLTLKYQVKLKNIINPKIKNIIISISFLSILGSLTVDITKAIPIRKKFNDRHVYLSSFRNSKEVIELEKLTKKAPKSLFYEEVSVDQEFWVNSCIASYYKVKKVKLKED